MSSFEHLEPIGLDEIAGVLDTYGTSRLAPTSPIVSRIRAAVMVEAATVAATRAGGRPPPAAEPPAPRTFGLPRLAHARVARPAFALGFAGLLALGTGAAVSAAPPGSPFYNARVVIEDIFLPAEIDARLTSHEEHLDQRLAEAEAAAARGDATGLAAALAAYQAEIDRTLADVGNDYGRLSHFRAVLEKHVAMLTALSLRLPTEVARQNAVEHAIEASQKAVTKVSEKQARADNRPSTPPRQEPSLPEPPGRP